MRWLRYSLALAFMFLFLFGPVISVWAASSEDPVSPPPTGSELPIYVVQPGETLRSISARVGVSVESLVAANGIQNPRSIYPGQGLVIGSSWVSGARHVLSASESLVTLCRSRGASLEAVARINGFLRATGLPVGTSLWLPEAPGFHVVPAEPTVWQSDAPRVVAAVLVGANLYDVLWLNPLPDIRDQSLLIPVPEGSVAGTGAVATSDLPSPLTTLSVSPQPVARGETVVVRLTASEPISCTLQAFGRRESCVPDPAGGWVALLGLSPVIEPGATTLDLSVTASDGAATAVAVPLSVGEGRYDYERIDLPPDRQSLLDPALSQMERDKIAQMQTLRSPQRLWEYPFRRPVDAAVTSYFGSRRSYGYGFGSFHAGSDFDGVGGEPVLAPASGKVILAEPLVVRGNAILVDHGWGVVSGFWHLSEIDVDVGEHVVQGQRIGLLGNTGLSTGAHLHWELWVNGNAVNAFSWLEPDGPASVLGAMP